MKSRLVLVLLCVAFLSCATGKLRPGTGDISFRLLWTGESDLDLYVQNSLGERIDFLKRTSESGGVLDVDCNVATTIEVHYCSEPMENIFWPKGKAPEGEYRYWPMIADPRGLSEDDVYKIEVRFGKKIVDEQVGRVVDLQKIAAISTIEYQREH